MRNVSMRVYIAVAVFAVAVGSVGIFRVFSQESGQDAPDAALPVWTRMVFAGDLASNGGCADRGTRDNCDIFEAWVDISSGAVRDVRQLTNTPESESYPVWHPEGDTAYFSIFRTAKMKDVGYVALADGATDVLVEGATWPAVSPDGTTLVYVEDATDTLMRVSLDEQGRTNGTAQVLTGAVHQQDPDFSSDGRYIVFHETGTGVGVGALYDRETQQTTSFGFRSGHCAFASKSLRMLCDNVSAGGLVSWTYTAGKLSTRELFVADQKPALLSTFDEALEGCVGTSFNYPTFCGDDAHVLASTSCNVGGRVAFSRLFLIDLSGETPVYMPIGQALADVFAGAGKSTWTADCL